MLDRSKPDRHPFPYSPHTGDIYMMRRLILCDEPSECTTEVLTSCDPQALWLWPDVRYGWGPQRREGATLALAILDRHLPALPGTVCDDWHAPLACHRDACRWAAQFQEDFLVRLPSHGGRIGGDAIRRWLREQRRRWSAPGVDLSLATLTSRYPEVMPRGGAV
jgi:hypothetical protein